MLKRLEELFRQGLENWQCELVEFGGENDHVHLLFESKPNINITDLITNLKTTTSRQIRKAFALRLKRYYWKPYFWSKAYAVITVGGRAPLEVLLTYIQTQNTPTG